MSAPLMMYLRPFPCNVIKDSISFAISLHLSYTVIILLALAHVISEMANIRPHIYTWQYMLAVNFFLPFAFGDICWHFKSTVGVLHVNKQNWNTSRKGRTLVQFSICRGGLIFCALIILATVDSQGLNELFWGETILFDQWNGTQEYSTNISTQVLYHYLCCKTCKVGQNSDVMFRIISSVALQQWTNNSTRLFETIIY